jgi:hypothetical protein
MRSPAMAACFTYFIPDVITLPSSLELSDGSFLNDLNQVSLSF